MTNCIVVSRVLGFQRNIQKEAFDEINLFFGGGGVLGFGRFFG